MEWKRLDISPKTAVVCQNATLSQFAAAFQRLYPGAKLLVPSEKERSAENSKRLIARITTSNFDAVLLPQSFVNMIEDDPDRVASYIREQVNNLVEARIRAADEDGKKSPRARDPAKSH